MKRILSVLAHPDDEIIFGWPVLQNRDCCHRVLIVAGRDDRNGGVRLRALRRAAELVEVEVEALDFAPRFGSAFLGEKIVLDDVRRQVRTAIECACTAFSPDFLFTHNASGEYGNVDHCFLNGLVEGAFAAALPTLVTDLYCPISTLLTDGWTSRTHRRRVGDTVLWADVRADETFLDRGLAPYRELGVLTWSEKWIPKVASVYRVRDSAGTPGVNPHRCGAGTRSKNDCSSSR